jgi:hypothetical protein
VIALLSLLSVILGITSARLFWQVCKQKALIEEARQKGHRPDGDREPRPLLTLHVLDPIALARRQSRSARMLADRLPATVTKLVYQGVMKELKKEMKEREIPVTMRLEYRQEVRAGTGNPAGTNRK